ncbi:MAG: lipoyl(octanoyl) transferase LipB [Opitutales bacterium]
METVPYQIESGLTSPVETSESEARAGSSGTRGTTLDWGLVPYQEAQNRQLALVADRIAGRVGDTLVFTHHPPVFTLGVRKGAGANLVWNAESLARRGVEVVETRRGGDVTCHSPGQMVGYPIVSLAGRRDLHGYLRLLEDVLIACLGELGLESDRREGMTGVWCGRRKVAAIGVAVRRWVTYHGFALNVENDLDFFNGIIPCGIAAAEGSVTSVSKELGRPVSREKLTPALTRLFWQHLRDFGL